MLKYLIPSFFGSSWSGSGSDKVRRLGPTTSSDRDMQDGRALPREDSFADRIGFAEILRWESTLSGELHAGQAPAGCVRAEAGARRCRKQPTAH